MKCSKCGKELKETERFCEECGTPVVREENKQNDIKSARNEIIAAIIIILVGAIIPIIDYFTHNLTINNFINELFLFEIIPCLLALFITVLALYKNPKNIIGNILLVLLIIYSIFLIIKIIGLIIGVVNGCRSCSEMFRTLG